MGFYPLQKCDLTVYGTVIKILQLIKSKRYWFLNINIIYSGLFTGEYDKSNGNPIFCRHNGDLWIVPVENVYSSKSEILKDYKGCKYVEE